MLHYLVVGGLGCVGFHLSRRLLSRGHKVTVLDDGSGWGADANARDLSIGWAVLRLSREDARDPRVWRGPMVPEPRAVDRAVWLAETDGEWERLDLQLRGVDNLLGWAARAAERGGRPPRVLVITAPGGGAAADAALARAGECGGADVRRAELFDVFGPRLPRRAALYQYAEAAVTGRDVVVCGPEAERSQLHVEDAVTALYAAVDRAELRGLVQLGGPRVWRQVDLARAVVRLFGSPSRVVEMPAADGRCVQRDDASRRVLRWDPAARLEERMSELLRWHRDGHDELAAIYDAVDDGESAGVTGGRDGGRRAEGGRRYRR